MNTRIQELAKQAKSQVPKGILAPDLWIQEYNRIFAELIVRECADICMEMAAKCAGLESDGALAKDCAYWIKKDFGVE